ncbi:MAG: hydrogen gas-evolving membrane-bound hydrogenase subunit E [Bacteroidota bacterium]|nr:hydrogen gas-evolving membrane-bound hydrogenase subunit E [Bacteroidota bacterium]
MIKKLLLFILLAGSALMFWVGISGFEVKEKLNPIASHYASEGLEQTGAANIVTAVVVRYRGLDTLGEVTILFLTASILGFFLIKREGKEDFRDSSEILKTASSLLEPIIILSGVYVFINGHLTPGGGFQGGAILASALILAYLANPNDSISKNLLKITESFSGLSFVIIGVLGIILAGGFLDSTLLPAGSIGNLISAGVIPIIYIFIGLKVGSELAGIVTNLKYAPKNESE